MYIFFISMVFFIWEKCICTSKCRIHFTECPDLKPLTGRSRCMQKKADDSSPERQQSIHDTDASKRAGSKKRESYAYMYMYIVLLTNENIHVYILYMHGVLYLGK